MTLVSSLRRARLRSGLSLRRAADLSGIAASNLSAIENGRRDPGTGTAARIADAVGITFIPVRLRGRTSAAEISDELTRLAGQPAEAYRALLQFADDLASTDAVGRVLLTVEEPQVTGTPWDAALAGVAEWRLGHVGAPVPSWISDTTRDPAEVWEPQRTSFPMPPVSRADRVPAPLLARGVLIEAAEFASA